MKIVDSALFRGKTSIKLVGFNIMVETFTVRFAYTVVSRKNKEGVRTTIAPPSEYELYNAKKLYRLNVDELGIKFEPGKIYIPYKVRLSPQNLYDWRVKKGISGQQYTLGVLALLSDKGEMLQFQDELSLQSRTGGSKNYNITDALGYLLFPKDKLINIKGRRYNVVRRHLESQEGGNELFYYIEVTKRRGDAVTPSSVIKSQLGYERLSRGKDRLGKSLKMHRYTKNACKKKAANIKAAYDRCTGESECPSGLPKLPNLSRPMQSPNS